MIRTEVVPGRDTMVTRVTFELPASMWAESVSVVGDFNAWSCAAHPMHQGADGTWRLTVDLDQPGAYRFGYLVDDALWLTDGSADWAADGPGGDCMVVRTHHATPRATRKAARRPLVHALRPTPFHATAAAAHAHLS
jgi:1,4-alpha-glucan branching enzyme